MSIDPSSEVQSLLEQAQQRLTTEELCSELECSERTLERWMRGTVPSARMVRRALLHLLSEVQPSSFVAHAPADFTFIDLFAGIGGTRLGWEAAGGECVFTSEYDRFCQETYKRWFRPAHPIHGDIREIKDPKRQIPKHDVLVAGFPCQPFSIAGVSKKNSLGRAHGFECDTQGTLFFDICRIIAEMRPAAFLLENVRNLRSHDKGRTFATIVRSLNELGYHLPEPAIIDARAWVPQHRERIFIAGFREPTAFNFDMVRPPNGPAPLLDSVLHPENGSEQPEPPFTAGVRARVNTRYTLTTHLWKYLQDYRRKHEAAGNGFGYSVVTRAQTARTLSARYYKDGSEILVSRGKGRTPRRLTPRECARLMGFPDSLPIVVSDTQAYRQFGNSVVVPVIAAIAQAMRPYVLSLKQRAGSAQQAFAA